MGPPTDPLELKPGDRVRHRGSPELGGGTVLQASDGEWATVDWDQGGSNDLHLQRNLARLEQQDLEDFPAALTDPWGAP